MQTPGDKSPRTPKNAESRRQARCVCGQGGRSVGHVRSLVFREKAWRFGGGR